VPWENANEWGANAGELPGTVGELVQSRAALGGLHLHGESHPRTLSIRMSNLQSTQALTVKITHLKVDD
jgi:hypothetical protein